VSKKLLAFVVALVMLVSAVPMALPMASAGQVSPATFVEFDGDLPREIAAVLAKDDPTVRLIVVPEKGHEYGVLERLRELGFVDPISRPEFQFIVVTMPRTRVTELESIPGILHVWEDRMVKLNPPELEGQAEPQMFLSVHTIGAYDAWVNYGVLGDNVTVAVLDTGVDVGHPFLLTTLSGERKIVDVYDATDEGYVQIYYNTTSVDNGTITVDQNVTVYWGAYSLYYGHDRYTTVYMGSYVVGNISGDAYYLGLLPERYFDLNNFSGVPNDPYGLGLFGDLSDVYPVLIVEANGSYVAYIDFDLDGDFTNDQPIGLYSETGDYATSPEMVNVAFSEFDPDAGYAFFMWDSHGHGTHVSGTVAGFGGNDPIFGGVYGVAPNAKLLEVRVLAGELGFGRTSWVILGMIEATLMGADVISMSLGSSPVYNDGLESPENFFVNLLSDQFGVVFVIAAGNDGPTINSVGAPGDSDLAITVGAYRSPVRWEVFYGAEGVPETVASFSSRGPRMDGLLDPDVIAPGEVIFSSLPQWYLAITGRNYGFWSGTSMATPHVSGAAALLISYARANGLSYDPITIKRALEMSGRPVEGTPIDQGFGLIQIPDAISSLEELSGQSVTYIYGGTSFTSFKNPINVPEIPSPAMVQFNGYFQALGLPYLYRGVYIRNEFPGSVPIYFYPMTYVPGEGLSLSSEEKVYTISTSVDWIRPNQTEVVAGPEGGSFIINIDYSVLGKSSVYVGYVYIDDPETSYIDGIVPVVVTLPMNPDTTTAALSDKAKPGVAKHYFVYVPRGTKELRVTLKVPTDQSGTAMGRTTMIIADPYGRVVRAYVPDYWFVGANGPSEYTWVIKDPVPGTWDLTAYTSVFTKLYTGYDESTYTITVGLGTVKVKPELLYKDTPGPDNVTVSARFINRLDDFSAVPVGYGVGRLDEVYAMIREVNQSDFDWIGIAYVTPEVYYIKFGITQPQVPTADLDLYVLYLDDLFNPTVIEVYWEQIGPTSDEYFERFMPKPGYYIPVVYGYDTAGLNPIQYVFYYQILGDNGDVKVETEPFDFKKGTAKAVKATVNLAENGTYLGIIGILDEDTGEIVAYTPMILQAGKPEVLVLTDAKAAIGQQSTLQILVLNKTSLEPITEPITVFVNDRPYYTINGRVNVTFIPDRLGEMEFKVQVVGENIKDEVMSVKVKVGEPLDEPVTDPMKPKVFMSGAGELKGSKATKVILGVGEGVTYSFTVDGPTGAIGYVTIALPPTASLMELVKNPHIISYRAVRGKNALYVTVAVKYASPVTLSFTAKVQPQPKGIDFNLLNFLYDRWYRSKAKEFNELYKLALERGVDESALQRALALHEEAQGYYQKATELAGGNVLAKLSDYRLLSYLRKAYVAENEAVKILKEALG